jgi:prepilin-type N-terminal cleavage/methylation domain-containing protein
MNRRRAGFTLIELTVVLAVVVVLSGLLILRVTGWTPRQSLNASARAFGGALGVWRERARFDETSYRVAWKDRAWTVTSSADERMAGGTLGSAQSFEDAGELVFDRRGVAAPRAIGLRHKSGDRVAVVVDVLLSGVKYE